MQENIYTAAEAIAHLKDAKKRGFAQSMDLIVNISNIDLKKPESRFSRDIALPHGRGKDAKVCMISSSIEGAIGKAEIEAMGAKEARRLSNGYDFFLCEAALMPLVGKNLGKYLGPKGKMPALLVPGKDPKQMAEALKESVRIRLRDSPVIQICVGAEGMEAKLLEENVNKAIGEIKASLPAKAQIKNAYLKLTMSRPVKIGV